MKKRLMVLLLALAMTFNLAACAVEPKKEEVAEVPASGETVQETVTPASFKIGVVTPTLSNSEDEYRAGENMAKKYPGMVEHIVLPEDTNENPQGGISQIISLADDKDMKAIVVASGQAGLLPAFQEVEAKRPDIVTITAPIWDDPDLMSEYIDINLDTDWARRGRTITEKAYDMGAKTFIHYSFPTHLSAESISKRRDMMKQT